MRLWDPATGTPVGDPLTGHTGAVWAVAAVPCPTGTLLATGSDDGTVRLWDPATGAPVGDPLTGHTGGVRGGGVRCRTGGPCSPPAAAMDGAAVGPGPPPRSGTR